jgi:hypothetical protein
MYETAPITITPDQALAAIEGNGHSRTDKAEAIDFLQDILANGPLPAKRVKAEATEAGITPKSLPRQLRPADRLTLGGLISPRSPSHEIQCNCSGLVTVCLISAPQSEHS